MHRQQDILNRTFVLDARLNHLHLAERNSHGSSRVGQEQFENFAMTGAPFYSGNANFSISTVRGDKSYELANHLGNVLSVVSDRKLPVGNTATHKVSYFTADVIQFSDYYPYGMQLPGRHSHDPSGDYRYGFQGQEKDDEVKGEGNSWNYKYRMHDARIGRFFAVDPLENKYPANSPYAFSENNVIHAVELEGLEKVPFMVINNITNSLQVSNFGSITNSSIVKQNWQQTVRNRQQNEEDLGLIARKRHSGTYNAGGIQLEVGKPSELLDDIVSNPTSYTLDCAAFCQVATLSAFKEVLGEDKFNSRFNSINSNITDEVRYDFFIMQHNSAGLKSISLSEFTKDVRSQEKGVKAAEKSRAGSRISLIADNPDIVKANGMDAYLTENIVHLGNGTYSGMGVGNRLSLDQVQQKLLETTGSTFSVEQVEQYKMGNKKTTKKNAASHRD